MENGKTENCGPGCNCNKPSSNRKAKTVVCIIVVIVVGCIFAYKAKSAKPVPTETATAFAATVANQASQTVPAIAEESRNGTDVNEQIAEQTPASQTVTKQNKVGEFLDSLSALNSVAANQDAVFVYIPAKGADSVGNEITNAVASAEHKIKATGANLGLYTLQSSSPEYANIAAQLSAPSMLVLSKGRGMGAVTGGITEEKILQAYVASSQAGCGPSGCGPSGCAPTAPAVGPRRTN